MLETGTSLETIGINRKVVDVTTIAKGVKNPKLFDEFLPQETKTSTLGEVTELKEYIIQNKDVVEKVFGKFGATPQENPEFAFEITDVNGEIKSSVRVTSDIDIQLKSGLSAEQVQKFAKGAFDIYVKNTGAEATIKGTLIETVPTELRGTGSTKLAHAVDIHSDFDSLMNPTGQQGTEKAWGITISEKPRLIENVPTSRLTEQVAGKMQSILDITAEGEFSPISHRIKDVPDYLMDAKTLVTQRTNPAVKARGLTEIQDIADYYGIGDIAKLKTTSITQEYIVSKPLTPSVNMTGLTPLLFSSFGSTKSKASTPNYGSFKLPSFNYAASPSVPSRPSQKYSSLPSLDYSLPSFDYPSIPNFPSPSTPPYYPSPSIPSPPPYYPPSGSPPPSYPPPYRPSPPQTYNFAYPKWYGDNRQEVPGFDRFSFPIFSRYRKYLWEFPIMDPKQVLKFKLKNLF